MNIKNLKIENKLKNNNIININIMRSTSIYDVDPNEFNYNKVKKTEDIFFYVKREREKKRRKNILKCCGGFGLIIGLNALSFYIGYIVNQKELI